MQKPGFKIASLCRFVSFPLILFLKLIAVLIAIGAGHGISGLSAHAQETAPQPGEVFVTRFAGTVVKNGVPLLDPKGIAAVLVDLRNPASLPTGRPWKNVPQRLSVTAGEVGLVFGIAIDDAPVANIYLAASSAFGLYRSGAGAGWMAGMWGKGGGPGAIYKLDGANGYRPEIFARIRLKGRRNSGAALGNIAYDKWHKQFYVSDLETGMIHRIALSNGKDLGHYDHGRTGRKRFRDALTGKLSSVSPVAFNPRARARVNNCPGAFATTPACWNFADFRRRVWGLGVRRDEAAGTTRLYYAIWGGQSFGNKAWANAGNDQRNTIWSIGIKADGAFDVDDIRREFFAPDFFQSAEALKRAGLSHPISDIAFPKSGGNVMALAERGGVSNPGPGAQHGLIRHHEARVVVYRLDSHSVWRPAGRYDVGYYARKRHGKPFMRANGAGGVDFGFGYTAQGAADTAQPDKFVWLSGSALCQPDGCLDAAAGKSPFFGLQGTPEDGFAELAPAGAFQPYPAQDLPYPASGPDRSYMLDLMAASGAVDVRGIGDIEAFAAPAGPPNAAAQIPNIIAAPDVGPTGPLGPGPAPAPDLQIVKTGPAECQPGGTCAYHIVITNLGTLDHVGAIAVRDVLPDGWSPAGGAGPGWNCILQPSLQKKAVVDCGLLSITLKPYGQVSMTVTAAVPVSQQPGAVTNCAELRHAPGTPDANPANDQSCATTSIKGAPKVGSNADLEIKKSIAGTVLACPANGTCRFEITVTNKGPDAYLGPVIVLDTLPTGWKFIKGSQPWFCQVKGSQFSCGLPPQQNLALNQTIKLVAELKTPPSGTQPLTAKNCVKIDWKTGTGDGNPANDQACETVTVPPGPPDLKIVKTGPAHCERGKACVYKIVVTNVGNSPHIGPIAIEERNFKFTNLKMAGFAPNPPWTCANTAPGRVKCSYPTNTIGPGVSLPTLTLTVHIPPNLTPIIDVLKDCAKIVQSSGDTNKANDESCVNTPIKTGWDLRISKRGPKVCYPEASGYCTYNINVINNGPMSYTGPLTVVERNFKFPGLKLSKFSHAPWQCKDTGPGVITCTHPSITLPANGVTGGLNITVSLPTALPPQLNALKDCARVIYKGGKPDINPANDEQCITVQLHRGGVHVVGETDWSSLLPWNWFSGGTISCTPPGCSFYEFTAAFNGKRRYRGPLTMRIDLPEGSRFDKARVVKSACSAKNWSCRKSGNGFVCRIVRCSIRPGGKVTVRMDGKLVPGMTMPPPVELKKTACGTLEWRAGPREQVDIEQTGKRGRKHTCFTTTILARARPGQCIGGQISKNGICRCPDGLIWNGVRCKEGIDAIPWQPTVPLTPKPRCPEGRQWNAIKQQCVPVEAIPTGPLCPGGQVRVGGICRCPEGQFWTGSACSGVAAAPKVIPPPSCRPGFIWDGRTCVPQVMTGPCPPRTRRVGQNCVRIVRPCSPGTRRVGRVCLPIVRPCPPGTRRVGRRCVPIVQPCPPGTRRAGRNCLPIVRPCPPGTRRVGRRCLPILQPCPPGTRRIGRRCVPIVQPCPPGTRRAGRNCLPIVRPCPPGTRRVGRRCLPILQPCPPGTRRIGRRCVPIVQPCPPGTRRAGRNCVPIARPPVLRPIPGVIVCPRGQVPFRGRCVKRIQ